METLSEGGVGRRPVCIAAVSNVSTKYALIEAEPTEHSFTKLWVREEIPETVER